MTNHKLDKFGRTADPKQRALEDDLRILAGIYRHVRDNEVERDETTEEYQAVMNQLYELGWDGHLYWESELPDEYMPEWYLERRGPYAANPFDYDRDEVRRKIETIKAQKRLEEAAREKRLIDRLLRLFHPK